MKEYLSKFKDVFYTPKLIYFFLLVAISLVAIASSVPIITRQGFNPDVVIRQAIFFVVGIFVMVGVLCLEMKRLRFLSWTLYVIFLLSLLPLFATGHIPGVSFSWAPNINGATRWLDFQSIPFQIQPSEFMRIAIILVLGGIIQKHNEKYPHKTRTDKTDLFLILKSLAVIALPSVLIYMQPDSGITILILLTTAIMLLASGIKWRYILAVGGLCAIVVSLFITLVSTYPQFLIETIGIRSYQISRFDGWFDPFGTISGDGRQLALGLMALGSGGMLGNGFQSGIVYFPEAHTDFIFAVIGKDFGMLGSLAVIIVYILFNFEVLNTATSNRGHYNSHVCVGIFASLMAQQFWNIGMTIGLLPISGVTLPFISHGGSSVLASMIMLGIILSSHIEGKTLKHKDATYQEGIFLSIKD